MSAGRRLAHALVASARAAGCTLSVSRESERAWESATFVGARHGLVVAGEPAAALRGWLAGLPDAALTVPGHLVAEVVVANEASGARLDALVLEASGA